MKNFKPHNRQTGATLIVGLIMLVLMTLIAVGAFIVSNSNEKAVANMQYKYESIAAANQAIEQVLSSPFTKLPTAETINVDINNDGINDYSVQITKPTCVRSAIENLGVVSSLQLGTGLSSAADWQTLWEFDAVVTNTATGANTTVRTGVRVVLSQVEKDAVCI